MRKYLISGVSFLALSASAVAADLPSRRAPDPYVPVPPAFTWTGFYVGINAGGVVSGDFAGTTLPPLPRVAARASAGGFVAGGTVGYNLQFGGFVVGVEGDAGYTNIGNRATAIVPGFGAGTVRAATDTYFATIRGRVGYAIGPVLLYGTGGWAFTEMALSANGTALGFTGNLNSRRAMDGWTAGGGVEYAITPGLSVKGEYLYAQFDRQTFSFPGLVFARATPRVRADLDTHLLRLGINYKFNWF